MVSGLVTVWVGPRCRHGRQRLNEQKNLYWGKQGKNTRPFNWRKNSKTNSFVGEATLRGDLTGNEVTLEAERKNGEQPSTQKHREARLGPDWVPLSRQEQMSMIEDQLAAL